MAVTVAVVPGFFVGIRGVCWDDLIEKPAQVADHSGLVLDGGQGGGRRRAKDRHRAVF
jgi:hypothetical protein